MAAASHAIGPITSVFDVIADLPIEDDPLWDIVDLGASGIRDMAANHDRYLVDGERADNQYGAVSFAVMRTQSITEVFGFDGHFRIMGFVLRP